MPLTNKQYDTIMRIYDNRQYHNYRTQTMHQEEVYRRFPKIRELEEEISSFSLKKAEQLFAIEPKDPVQYDQEKKQTLESLRERLEIGRASCKPS